MPSAGTTWQIELLKPLNDTSADVEVYDIDLFDNNASIIDTLHSLDRKVICYFSAGSYENWRPDASSFDDADLGDTLEGWSNEKWLNISSPNVHTIMLTRLDLAVNKSCDGVDPDNIDGYDNQNGLDLTEQDSIDYMGFLATAAHERNMSIGLKNAGSIIPDIIDYVDWSVNEQCVEYDECSIYVPFIQQDKPVFHIEYPKGDTTDNTKLVSASQKDTVCSATNTTDFSTVIKNMNLDAWVEYC